MRAGVLQASPQGPQAPADTLALESSWFLSKGSGQGNGCVTETEVWNPPPPTCPGSAAEEVVTLSPEIPVWWGCYHPPTSTVTLGLWDREEKC